MAMTTFHITMIAHGFQKLYVGDQDWLIFNESDYIIRAMEDKGQYAKAYFPIPPWSPFGKVDFQNRKGFIWLYNTDGDNTADINVVIG